MTADQRLREAEAFQLHAELCKSLTDPKRLLMLRALRSGECSVGELADMVGMTLANASQHLSVLRHAGLVLARREGTTVHYSLLEPRIVEACDIVHQIVEDRLEGRHRRRVRHPATSILMELPAGVR
jgi:DNA-binding transcriptional ArsR family regulator